MAILGFILGFLVLSAVTLWLLGAIWLAAVWSPSRGELIIPLPFLCILGYLWYLLFTNAPFTIVGVG